MDAGKTTLSEGLLYLGGAIRKMGRVDSRDAFLDTDEMERARGITIYSKTARFASVREDGTVREYTLLDTPGHSDFGAEMERVLPMLDAAILLISAPEGVNVQVRLLSALLKHYRVPVFIFVNKMDQAGQAEEGEGRREEILREIHKGISENAVDFTGGPEDTDVMEQIALISGDEQILERIMEGGSLSEEEIGKMIASRELFPVFFGSALKMQGISELMSALDRYVLPPAYPNDFGARICKITRDASGERETWLKVTGGTLRVRQAVTYSARDAEAEQDGDGGNTADETGGISGTEEISEKINQIRLYSGERYDAVSEAKAGTVCAVTGLTRTYAGQGIGADRAEFSKIK